ncbi:molybdopterin molybdotransferase MoeA [Arthrobacter sp. KK5.5]|uniref:molybdopterin molybdotransferase MoeA n=1 Tax=Arthrobacter sp. KK5.5 TaxID=3373084 RepID=UPI003EE57553
MEPTFRRTVDEHRETLRVLLSGPLSSLGTESVPLADARGRTLAVELSAPRNLPPFDNSQMDGFAVRTADLAPGGPLAVARPIPAGAAAPALPPGAAAPVMTGSMLPAGADAVVPVEAADPPVFPDFVGGGSPYDGAATVRLPASHPAGRFVRRAGSDIAAGTAALAGGTRLGPAQLGLAAALGVAELDVVRRPLALLISTGDEVAAPGSELKPGQIHDANTTLLRACLEQAGWEVRPAGISADDVAGFVSSLAAELGAADGPGFQLVLTSGGISKGAYEVVRLALAAHGVTFGSVALQPGGPQGSGLLELPGVRPVPVVAFPGNPVSSFVSFELFLRPAFAPLIGLPHRRSVDATLAHSLAGSPNGKVQARRGVYSPESGRVATVGGMESHLVHALARSNALILIPGETTEVAAGATVETMLMGDES